MGFFASGSGQSAGRSGTPSLELIHRLECKVCPLNKIDTNSNPHMEPTGASDPLIYVLGEAPGKDEDYEGKQFVGESGQLLRARLPKELRPFIRWNNVVRTRPPKSRTPERIEIEACRPSVERDIAATKPKAIFGFGPIPLHWVLGQSGMAKWRGRRVPVEIAGHQCWYYAFEHPLSLLRKRKRNGDISEDERAFRFDLQRAIDEVEHLPEPVVLGRADAEAGIELIPCTNAGLDRLEQHMRWAVLQPVVGFDWETNTLRPYGKPTLDKEGNTVVRWDDALILSAAIGTPKHTVAFGIDHPQAKWTKAQRARLEELLNWFLRQPKVRKAVHNLAFEMEWGAMFYGADILRAGLWDCTYTQAALLDERSLAGQDDKRTGGASLDDLVLNHFGLHLKSLSPLDRKNLADEPLETVLKYNGMDAKFHCMLYLVQRGLLEAQGLQRVYIEEDLERVPTVVLTQLKGIPRDQAVTEGLQKKYRARVKRLEGEIAAMPEAGQYERRANKPFNPMSNAHCITLFRDILKYEEGFAKGTETRDSGFVTTHAGKAEYKVDKKVLDAIGTPLTKLIIELREANKRLATYIDSYADGSPFVWPDGLLHPIINSQGTKSGRTSAEDPNIQNAPKRNEEAKEVRRQVVAVVGLVKGVRPKMVIVAVDQGQIQARGIAMMSRDKAFSKALWERYDVHTEWTERIAYAYPKRVGGKQFLKDKKVMKAFRTDIKNQWTFPLFFGAKLYGISQFLQIPEEVLEPLMDEFWKTFHGVADWHQRLLKEYHETGAVRHLNGRLSRAPLSFNQMINYPIQGIEAEIVMEAYRKLSLRCTDTGDINWQPNIEVHDDLTNILPYSDELHNARRWLAKAKAYTDDGDKKKALEEAAGWAGDDRYVRGIVTDMLGIERPYINVPLTAEVTIGDNWLDMDEVLVASSDTWKKAA